MVKITIKQEILTFLGLNSVKLDLFFCEGIVSTPFWFFSGTVQCIYNRLTDSLNWTINLSVCGVRNQHPVVWTLPCIVTFIWNFILTWKCQKWYLDTGNLVYKQLRFANLSALLQFYNKCPFLCPFWFFWTLPYNSRLFPAAIYTYICWLHITLPPPPNI